MRKQVYLDYAAATPLDDEVLAAMQPYFSKEFFNPSAMYSSSRDVKRTLNEARSDIARHLAARPSEIIFTAGGTEANNLAINGVMNQYKNKKLLISSIEHESVRMPASQYSHEEIKVSSAGQLDIDDLKQRLSDEVVLVSIIYASNEIGTIQDLASVAEVIKLTKRDRLERGVDAPLYFHTDACQAVLYLNIAPARLGVDLMTINGGKIYGPKQSGILFVKAGAILNPIILGGGQERNLRSGTENVPAAIGLAAALKKARALSVSETKRLAPLRDKLVTALALLPIEIIFHGDAKKHLPNHLSFAVVGFDNERLMMEFDELGFMVATGSACSAAKVETSHVLRGIGVSGEMAASTLRVTMGRDTTEASVTAFVRALASIVSK